MTIRTATYDAIEYLLLDDSQVEAIGIAYESGDLTELGRLYAAAINRQISKFNAQRKTDLGGLFASAAGVSVGAQFDAEFARDAGGRL